MKFTLCQASYVFALLSALALATYSQIHLRQSEESRRVHHYFANFYEEQNRYLIQELEQSRMMTEADVLVQHSEVKVVTEQGSRHLQFQVTANELPDGYIKVELDRQGQTRDITRCFDDQGTRCFYWGLQETD